MPRAHFHDQKTNIKDPRKMAAVVYIYRDYMHNDAFRYGKVERKQQQQ